MYSQAQNVIFTARGCDLSTYRMRMDGVWHVVVMGKAPRADLDEKFESILADGDPVTLPPDIVDYLRIRRTQATKLGSWVERHYRE